MSELSDFDPFSLMNFATSKEAFNNKIQSQTSSTGSLIWILSSVVGPTAPQAKNNKRKTEARQKIESNFHRNELGSASKAVISFLLVKPEEYQILFLGATRR